MKKYIYEVMLGLRRDPLAVVLRAVLWVLSLFYGIVAVERSRLYDLGILPVKKLGRPVISVGNLTWGGVGKTPCVIALCRYILSRGKRPAVLLRGYMPDGEPSDEAQVIQKELPEVPVGVGADRFASAQNILAKEAVDVFVLDDGFQHRGIARDLDLVLVDPGQTWDHPALIPCGIFREPRSALKRADGVILTKTDLYPAEAESIKKELYQKFPSVFVVASGHKAVELLSLQGPERKSLNTMTHVPVIAFCGIGDPKAFFSLLAQSGIRLVGSKAFDDHHTYNDAEIRELADQARSVGGVLVTTLKDAVKLNDHADILKEGLCWVLKIEFDFIEGKDVLLERIDHLLAR